MGGCSSKARSSRPSSASVTAAANAAMARDAERVSCVLTASPVTWLNQTTRERLSSKEDAFKPRDGADSYEQLLAKARKMRETGRSQASVEIMFAPTAAAPGGCPGASSDASPAEVESAVLSAFSDWSAEIMSAGLAAADATERGHPESDKRITAIAEEPSVGDSGEREGAAESTVAPVGGAAATVTVVAEDAVVLEGRTAAGATLQWAMVDDPASKRRSVILSVRVGDRVATVAQHDAAGEDAPIARALAEAAEAGRERARSYVEETSAERRAALANIEQSVMASLEAALAASRKGGSRADMLAVYRSKALRTSLPTPRDSISVVAPASPRPSVI